MPHANIWIRKEDWDKWQLIDNKAELISQAINRSEIQVVQRKGELKTRQTIQKPVEPIIIKNPAEAKNVITESDLFTRRPNEYCKHGAAKGFCKLGCK